MTNFNKSKEELLQEIDTLNKQNESLIALFDKFICDRNQTEQELILSNQEIVFEKEEKSQRAAELIIANLELAFQSEEKKKRAEELIIANIELVYQNEEKRKRASELIIANNELVFQNEEKEKRSSELINALEKGKLLSDLISSHEALIISEINYRRLFESAKDGILILDAETGEIVDVNPFLIKLLGYSKEQFLKKTIWEIGFFKDVIANRNNFLELQLNEYIRYENLPLETAYGHLINVEFISNVYFVNQSKVIQCNIRNITDRVKLEQQEKLTNKILKLLNRPIDKINVISEILKLIKEHIGFEAIGIRLKENGDYPYFVTDGFSDDFLRTEKYLCMYNDAGEFIYDSKGNPFLECMCGNIISGRTDPTKLYFSENGSFWTNSTTDLLATTKNEAHNVCTRNRCNKYGYESFALIPLRSGNEIIGLLQLNDHRLNQFTIEMIQFFEGLGASIGIALSRKQALDELIISKDKAEESDKLKTAFLQNMSHEIRTPLNGIIGFSTLLKSDDICKEEIKEFTDIIIQSGNRLLNIVNNVLDFSKIQTGQVVIERKPIVINSVFSDLLSFFSLTADVKNIKLNFFIRNDKYKIIYSDAEKLYQILTNLINNAIKFTKSGSIDFGYEIKEKVILFFVKDTGIGISVEYFDKIFDRFTQGEQSLSRLYEGAGLGLAISKGLVESLGGKIWLESEINKGTTFFFTLPLIPIVQNPQPEIKYSEQSLNTVHGKILIAEDDWVSYQYLSKLITKSEIIVIHAENGKEAVDIVRNTPDLDLILMDIRMPVMDGIEATKLINQIRPDLPIVAQTAYAFSEEKNNILAIGCVDYISKPIELEKFNKILYKYLLK